METVALVASVTALEFVQDTFLLSGEGPVLTLYSLYPHPKNFASLCVLQHQRIHGIRPRILPAPDLNSSEEGTRGPGPSFYDLAVFGGKAVRLVCLNLSDAPHLENMGPIMELRDWVLDVRWMSGDPLLCVALAHNSALLLDTKSGTPLYHRSCSEGCLLYSALVITHKSWCDTVVIGGTVFNQLVIWRPGDVSSNPEPKSQVERRLLGHSGVIFAISYSQKDEVIASASDDRSVRIWQIGQLGGTGGQCGDTNPTCLHVLYGHQARVFAVKLSCDRVISAGEDGACLLWENGKVVQTLKGHRAGGVRALAISSDATWVATGGADGGVRLWKLGMKQDKKVDNDEKLVDLKFPKDKMDCSDGKKTKAKLKDDDSKPKSGKHKQIKGDCLKSGKEEMLSQSDNFKVKMNATKMDKQTIQNVEEQQVDYAATLKTDDQSNLETEKEMNQDLEEKWQPKPKVDVVNQEDNPDLQEAKKSKTKKGETSKVDYEMAVVEKGLQLNEREVEIASHDKPKASGQSKDEMPAKQKANLCKIDSDITSVGVPKVICTLDAEKSTWSNCEFVVCTDKGGVYQYSNEKWDLIWQGPLEFQSYCVMEVVSLKIQGLQVHLCAVGNISGCVQVFPIANPKDGVCFKTGSGKIHSLIWQKEIDGGAWLLASGSSGLVYRWLVDVSANLELKVKEMAAFELPTCAKRWLTAAMRGEIGNEVVWVCGDRRGSLLLYQEETKSTKEQKGILAVSKNELKIKLTPASILFGVHSKQGVTSVFEHLGLFYSTGRDGCVRIFQVSPKISQNLKNGVDVEQTVQEFTLEVLRVQRACKGMEWLEKVFILDANNVQRLEDIKEMGTHLYEDQKLLENKQLFQNIDKTTPLDKQEARFAIVGFHGIHFIVWDPVRQERLFSVQCGGGHRSWSLWVNQNNIWTGNGALVFIKQGEIFASERTLLETSSKIGWTLREGLHGRGIDCVSRLGSIKNGINGYWEVVLTGGEDTSVTILAINPKNGNIKVLAMLIDHISSVRALTAVVNQDGGSKGFSALVVSAGGRAQMQCYRLLIGWDERTMAPSCQVIQVAAHRLDEQWERKRNRHKMVKMDPETRYMSMAVLEQSPDSLTVALACSDGAVRLFSVSEVTRHVELLWESFHHQRCVLSVATWCLKDAQENRSNLLFSAATDGLIAVWDFTSLSSSNEMPLSPIFTIPAHQSGINSLDISQIRILDFHHITIASGGDDGQLTVSKIKVEFIDKSNHSDFENHLSVNLESQFIVPLAHAAPLTSLKLLNENLVMTTSCDQRVCLWRVCSAGICHERALCSHVADTAALGVWGEENDSRSGLSADQGSDPEFERVIEKKLKVDETENTVDAWVLVCGQGLQLIQVRNILSK